jgi:hypothetical protein
MQLSKKSSKWTNEALFFVLSSEEIKGIIVLQNINEQVS